MNYFYMDHEPLENQVQIENEEFSQEFIKACRSSEFQFLTHRASQVSSVGGFVFPDLLVCADGAVPLISVRLFEFLDSAGVDNLFYKRIDIVENNGMKHKYFLALPPSISCLDMSRTKFTGYGRADEVHIDSRRTGNYMIFKLADAANSDIIVTSDLAEKIKKLGCTGISFFPV